MAASVLFYEATSRAKRLYGLRYTAQLHGHLLNIYFRWKMCDSSFLALVFGAADELRDVGRRPFGM